MDNPEPHFEGGPDCWMLKIRISPELLRQWAFDQHCTVEIGTPDRDGFVEPIFTRYDYHGPAPAVPVTFGPLDIPENTTLDPTLDLATWTPPRARTA